MQITGQQQAEGWWVPPSSVLRFDPYRSTSLTLRRNMICEGTLEMKPARSTVTHRITFDDVDEAAMQGGGMDPLDTDVGLWVVKGGRLDLRGTARGAWTRSSSLPSNWRIGDELWTTPTTEGDYACRAGSFPDGLAEIMNLTRNVIIEGTPSGRAHIFIHNDRPVAHSIRYALLRHLGARRGDREIVLGRYGLHFHHCGDFSRGSLVHAVVVRETGNRAYVPHASHGIQFRDCIAFRTQEEAFWWDPPPAEEPITNDVLWYRCLVAENDPAPTFDSRIHQFVLGLGSGNRCVGCVATAGKGTQDQSGFGWDQEFNPWTFEDCIAHNNKSLGAFIWGNPNTVHPVARFRAYHNAKADVEQHAYANTFTWRDCVLDSPESLFLFAVSKGRDSATVGTRFDRVLFAGRVTIGFHQLPASVDQPVVFADCALEGGVLVDERKASGETGERGLHRFEGCTRAGRGLVQSDFTIMQMHPDSVIEIRNADGSGFVLS